MKLIFYLLLFLSFYSCSNEDNFLKLIESNLSDIPEFDKDRYNYIVIIPGAGCTGCISEAESFYNEHKRDSIFYIFTKITSKKALKLRLGNINNSIAYIDEDSKFLSTDNDINLYPVVIDFRNKKTIKWTYLDPGRSLETLFDKNDD